LKLEFVAMIRSVIQRVDGLASHFGHRVGIESAIKQA